ncbi:ComEA family DNA-binding protein [Alicyclobacillus vulcanalis]|uniref:Competence protein ComEA n=1 Tax=Alicyclobacillus vulcanalis TaxID=252246 RepID=A0A1N7KZR3_9BACL|nr:ComEA family DNA-binding protein [Alicyclobacillus vulcanalis]SIS67122.1 competence protein ComEA [Alicyclobacillus vulcanalis]
MTDRTQKPGESGELVAEGAWPISLPAHEDDWEFEERDVHAVAPGEAAFAPGGGARAEGVPRFAWIRAWSGFVRAGLTILLAAGAAWFGSERAAAMKATASSPEAGASSAATKPAPSADTEASNEIALQVDVHGDVLHPGLVSLPAGSRVRDAIRAAGGLRHADDASTINQAALVWDGEEIDVPAPSTTAGAGEVDARSDVQEMGAGLQQVSASDAPAGTSARGRGRAHKGELSSGQKININTADMETLETLPGVGPKRAQAILAYRQAHGPFPNLESLRHVKGIGEKTLAKWKDLITFGSAGGNADGGQARP